MRNPDLKRDLQNAILEGVFAQMFATLTSGVFLTSFALFLGMDDLKIGVLAALPYLVTVFQLPAAYLIERSGHRKGITIKAATAARLMWLPILLIGVTTVLGHPGTPLLVITLIFFSNTFSTAGNVSWLTWMSDVVPERIRGRFFGTRNMLCGAAGMAVLVAFGHLLDLFQRQGGVAGGLRLTFLAAVFFGLVSIYFLGRISQPDRLGHEDPPLRNQLWVPLEDTNFRRFLLFNFAWSFSVYLASPFFTLYFLRELHFSYGFVATLGMLSAFADLMGMRIWGRVADRVKNKAVIQVASWVAAFLPVAWSLVRPREVIFPILLHLIGGAFWAGINLCTNNLLLGISPPRRRSLYISLANIAGGIGAAIAPVVSGIVLTSLQGLELHFIYQEVYPLHIVFLLSTLLRLVSRGFLNPVQEPKGRPAGEVVRILRSIRGLNMTTGFNYLLHPFLEIARKGWKR